MNPVSSFPPVSSYMQHLLADVKSWAVFQQIAATLGPRSKGDLFELLTKHYLLFSPTYNTTLSDVWLLDEVPEKLRASLRHPQGDQGIDLIARTKAGGFWAIQCKYRTGKNRSLTWREISTFVGLAFGVFKGIEYWLFKIASFWCGDGRAGFQAHGLFV